jgi:hypothetical protein
MSTLYDKTGLTADQAAEVIPALLAALEDAADWNAADIRGFDDIQPDMAMLKARRKVLRAAIAKAKGAE